MTFMAPLALLLTVFLFAGCKENDHESFIRAEVDGNPKSTSAVSVERLPGSNDLVSFSGSFRDGTSIGFRVSSQPSFATGTYSFRGSEMLPVTLLSFTLTVTDFKPVLKWSTAQETGLSSFTVERSPTGTNFQPIGSVPATNTATVHNYELPDNGINTLSTYYYRLRVTDSSGQFNYSSVLLYNASNMYVAYLEDGMVRMKGYNGRVDVTAHDRNKRIVEGSFTFDVKNDAGEVRQVRNGSFRVNY